MNIPTYSDIYQSVLDDLKNKLGITSVIGKSVLPAFAAVYAAKYKILYLIANQINKNIYPDTSDEENLRRAGRIVLGRDINGAVAGEYVVTITGESGSTIPVNTTFSDSKGYLYILDTSYTLRSGTGTITLRALTAGSDSVLVPTDVLQITSKIADIDSYATVSSVSISPASAEDIEEYRQNVIEAYRLQPQGGSRADYRIWTQPVSGRRQVYPYVCDGYAGEINLYVEAFPIDSNPVGSGIPTQALLNDVRDAIEPTNIPMTVKEIHYLPIVPLDIDVAITDMSDESKLTAIEDSIKAYLYEIRPYIAGADISADINKGRMYASEIEGIIINAGVTFTSVSVSVDGSPVTTYEFIDENIPFLNPVTSV